MSVRSSLNLSRYSCHLANLTPLTCTGTRTHERRRAVVDPADNQINGNVLFFLEEPRKKEREQIASADKAPLLDDAPVREPSTRAISCSVPFRDKNQSVSARFICSISALRRFASPIAPAPVSFALPTMHAPRSALESGDTSIARAVSPRTLHRALCG